MSPEALFRVTRTKASMYHHEPVVPQQHALPHSMVALSVARLCLGLAELACHYWASGGQMVESLSKFSNKFHNKFSWTSVASTLGTTNRSSPFGRATNGINHTMKHLQIIFARGARQSGIQQSEKGATWGCLGSCRGSRPKHRNHRKINYLFYYIGFYSALTFHCLSML